MHVLAINPWIYDFAAYDFWLKPYGFLVILEYLKSQGADIHYLDCLEKKETYADFGRGKYHSEIIKKPEIFANIPRYYKRYGLTPDEFEAKLPSNKGDRHLFFNKNLDYILITSSMTYWYPGIIEAIKILKKHFPETPIIVGGTYATLCYEHAKKNIPADYIFANGQLDDFFKLLGIKVDYGELYAALPDYENFYPRLDYAVFRTSWGCPFDCSYCAVKKLSPYFFRLAPGKIIEFIKKYAGKNIKDFVLYDDAFLCEPEYAKNFLREIAALNLGLRFHTPNALHLRYLDEELAALLKATGFINPHFGLETLDPDLEKQWGDKVNRQDVIHGAELLKKGGFEPGEFSAYLLLGYPGQNLETLKTDVDFLHRLGAKASFAEFSPTPGTRMFEAYRDKFSEPLLQNNSVFGAFSENRLREFWEIKNYLRELNRRFEGENEEKRIKIKPKKILSTD
jgi:radical SAM superfamily enzyme YgiQ (UPF0313 family)